VGQRRTYHTEMKQRARFGGNGAWKGRIFVAAVP